MLSTSMYGPNNPTHLLKSDLPILKGVAVKSTPSICPPAAILDWKISTETAKIADRTGWTPT